MAEIYVGTAYHQVFRVPLDLKAPIVKIGEKKKSPVTSISYPFRIQDAYDPFMNYSDRSQSYQFNNQDNSYGALNTLPMSLQKNQNILLFHRLLGKQLYFTSHGNVYHPSTKQNQTKWAKLYYNQLYANAIKSLPPQRSGSLKPEYTRVVHSSESFDIQIGFSGRGVLPFVYEIKQSTSLVTWKAKNVSNDELDLEVPINDVDLCFFHKGCNLAVAHANNKIRIYDIKSNRRKPTNDIRLIQIQKFEKGSLVKMAKSQCEKYMYVANNRGSIYELDMRKDMQMIGKIKGIVTTIKDMQVSRQRLAVISLDGYLRIFNLTTKQKQYQRYLNTSPEVLKICKDGIYFPEGPNFQVSQLNLENENENQEQKEKQPQKVKKIRKRNKVGLKYVESANLDFLQKAEDELKDQMGQNEQKIECKYEDEDLDL